MSDGETMGLCFFNMKTRAAMFFYYIRGTCVQATWNPNRFQVPSNEKGLKKKKKTARYWFNVAKTHVILAIFCDLFGVVKWPLQRLSDLQLGDKKVTAWITWMLVLFCFNIMISCGYSNLAQVSWEFEHPMESSSIPWRVQASQSMLVYWK